MKLSYKVKNQLIESILGELLFPLGFKFISIDHENWNFSKREGDAVKKIRIIINNSPEPHRTRSYIAIQIDSNQPIQPVLLSDLTPDADFDFLGIEYTNKDSFIEALLRSKKLLEQYGLNKLEQISEIKTEIRATRKNSLYMWENSRRILAEKKKEWGLEENSFDEQLAILSDKIEQEKGKQFADIETVLADIAVVYGDLYIQCYGGSLEWFDYANNYIVNIGTDPWKFSTTEVPLISVITQWKGEKTILSRWEEKRKDIERQKRS